MRCLALAKKLSTSGWRCAFAVNPGAKLVVPELEHSGFELVVLAENATAEDLEKHFPEGVELLLVDNYGLDADFESSCRSWAKTIMVIDDLADRPHDCDLLLDTTPGRAGESYMGLVPDRCRLLLGPVYAILRDEFAMLRGDALARREVKTTIDRVLVSFGLTDPAGATANAVRGVLESGARASVDVVLNSRAPDYERVAGLARNSEKIRLLEYADDMAELMAQADLALGAAGTTSWERCCLGLPTVLMVLADNQEMNAKGLALAGAALNLGRVEAVKVSDVSRAVTNIAGHGAALRSMSEAAAGMCDGRGATRVALEVHPPAKGGDGGLVRMRPARAEDMEIMFQWQTHPETRRFARNPDPPARDEHRAWFSHKMADAACELLIILYEGREAGIFRLDRLESGAREVSIVIAPELRGLGIGSAALSFANGFWPREELHAEILQGNEVSRRMFSAAGYEKVSDALYVRAC